MPVNSLSALSVGDQPVVLYAKQRTKSRLFAEVLLAQLLYWALLYATVAFVAVVYPEEIVARFSMVKAVEGGIALAIVGTMVARAKRGPVRVSQIVLHLVNAFLVIPIVVYYAARDESRVFFYAVMGSFALLGVLVRILSPIRIPRANRQLLLAMASLGVAVTLYVYGALVATGALGRLNFNLWNVYESRTSFLEASRFPLVGYLLPWQGYVVNTAVLAFGLHRRSWTTTGLALGAQMLLFAMANFKSILFAPILVIAIVLLAERRSVVRWVYAGSALAIALSYVVYVTTGDHMTPSIFIRRMFLVPAKNHFLYYEWFSEHPRIMLSNSVLSLFIDYPYDVPVTRVISWAYYGRDFGPNVGYLGDAYAHFGVPGMLGFTVILALVLRALDSLAKNVPVGVSTAVVVIPIMAIMNSGLLTTLLTHGLGASALLVWGMSGLFAGLDRRRTIHVLSSPMLPGPPRHGSHHVTFWRR